MNKIIITVEGRANSGKTSIQESIAKYLLNFFDNVSIDYGIDGIPTCGLLPEEIMTEISQKTHITITTKQAPRKSMESDV